MFKHWLFLLAWIWPQKWSLEQGHQDHLRGAKWRSYGHCILKYGWDCRENRRKWVRNSRIRVSFSHGNDGIPSLIKDYFGFSITNVIEKAQRLPPS